MRKVIWNLIAGRVKAGDTASHAINAIYVSVGPNLSVTQIITAIKRSTSRVEIPITLCLDNGTVHLLSLPLLQMLLTALLNLNLKHSIGVSIKKV